MQCECGYKEESFIHKLLFCNLTHIPGLNLKKFLLKNTGTLIYENYLQILSTSNSTKDTIIIIKLTLIFMKAIGKLTICLSF